ncbi:hypothetical protein NS228_25735 [Methylobacterium indicum]|uniref:hypothetical protein n=1 Tax=Methylobacterium indicum TaxID=1775910 RepID=UPI000734E549|nr:hypothetical protein [Methylobacterium indicum]KTS25032.1 hypothetical protein NS229_20690 [Methylobacterium indicum]KTS25737.1 hypothetical protein NS228_25735 [Methylobacterium indicum]KTS44578.1 hypothetical protein NS230_25205 [Methylobacterium indicum]
MSGPGGRLRLVALGLALLTASAAPAAEGDSPIGTIMDGLTGGGSRRDLMDRIERSENERARQQAERTATEAEIRGLLRDIDDKIFSIRLNLAEFAGNRPSCRTLRARAAALDAQIADLDHLAASAQARCRASSDTEAVTALCRTRLAEIARDRAAAEAAQARATANCPSDSSPAKELRP